MLWCLPTSLHVLCGEWLLMDGASSKHFALHMCYCPNAKDIFALLVCAGRQGGLSNRQIRKWMDELATVRAWTLIGSPCNFFHNDFRFQPVCCALRNSTLCFTVINTPLQKHVYWSAFRSVTYVKGC